MTNSHYTMMGYRNRRLALWFVLGIVLVAGTWFVRPRWERALALRRAATSAQLTPEDLRAGLPTAPKSQAAALARIWQNPNLEPRRAVLAVLAPQSQSDPVLGLLARRLIDETAADPDESLREVALGLAWPGMKDAVVDAAIRQLNDGDAVMRKLGLQSLRSHADLRQVPIVMPMLTDIDPTVALAADALLRKITGQDMGLRLADQITAGSGLLPDETKLEVQAKIARGRAAWEAWWKTQAGSNSRPPSIPLRQVDAPRPVADFQLPDAQGRLHRLRDYRGRTVLVNFWTTWCPPCLNELPTLAELQRRHPDDVQILGISLDNYSQGPLAESIAGKPAPGATESIERLRLHVGATAARHRVNYPILLDPDGSVGLRFNGGELPTQVLIDRQGHLRRRFVGARSIDEWEILIKELHQSPVSIGR